MNVNDSSVTTAPQAEAYGTAIVSFIQRQQAYIDSLRAELKEARGIIESYELFMEREIL